MKKEHKAKTLWESEGKTPDGNPFFAVKQARDYYFYGTRGGQDSIFFILIDNNRLDSTGLIHESKPPLDDRTGTLAMLTTAFGGSIDSDITLDELVRQEVREEAGYDVPLDRITNVGHTLVSSQMDQIAHGFVVDVTNIDKTLEAEYEAENATEEFASNEVRWLNPDEVISNSDWKSIFCITKVIFAQWEKHDVSDT